MNVDHRGDECERGVCKSTSTLILRQIIERVHGTEDDQRISGLRDQVVRTIVTCARTGAARGQ